MRAALPGVGAASTHTSNTRTHAHAPASALRPRLGAAACAASSAAATWLLRALPPAAAAGAGAAQRALPRALALLAAPRSPAAPAPARRAHRCPAPRRRARLRARRRRQAGPWRGPWCLIGACPRVQVPLDGLDQSELREPQIDARAPPGHVISTRRLALIGRIAFSRSRPGRRAGIPALTITIPLLLPCWAFLRPRSSPVIR